LLSKCIGKFYLAGYILKSSVLEFCGLRGLLTLFSNDQVCQNLGNIIIIGLYYTCLIDEQKQERKHSFGSCYKSFLSRNPLWIIEFLLIEYGKRKVLKPGVYNDFF